MLSKSLKEPPQYDYARKMKMDIACIACAKEKERMAALVLRRHSDHKVRCIPHVTSVVPSEYECMIRAYSQLSMIRYAVMKHQGEFKDAISLTVVKNIGDMLVYICAALNHGYFCNDMLVLSYSILSLAQ